MGELYDELNKLSHSDMLPLHMPGHKRRDEEEFFKRLYALDITEIEPFDNLHDAKGIIKRAEERSAGIWGADESHFLVNGSTCGNLTAVFAAVPDGGEVIVARNCHTSIYHGIELRRLTAHYIYPEKNPDFNICLGIRAAQIRDKINEFPDSKAVIITSPTYEGYVSEIEEISEICHAGGIPLIVDEAHGAHFGFHGYFPETAVKLGADIVVQSLHKTLPSMTQTAILHVRDGEFVDVEKVRKYLTYFQTTSPSYIFLASIEHCLDRMEESGFELMEEYGARLQKFYEYAKKFRQIKVLITEGTERDPGKIIVKKTGRNGKELAKVLTERFQIQCEMCTPEYVLLMTSIYDTDDMFVRLTDALLNMERDKMSTEDKECLERKNGKSVSDAEDTDMSRSFNIKCGPECVYTLSEAAGLKSIRLSREEAQGKISGKAINLYPPGTPFILPGERYTEEILRYLSVCEKAGFEVIGMESGEVWVIEEGMER